MCKNCAILLSLPAWECGLKYDQKFIVICRRVVTPCVGVWVEIPQKLRPNGKDTSLPVSEHETKFLMYIMELNEAGLY